MPCINVPPPQCGGAVLSLKCCLSKSFLERLDKKLPPKFGLFSLFFCYAVFDRSQQGGFKYLSLTGFRTTSSSYVHPNPGSQHLTSHITVPPASLASSFDWYVFLGLGSDPSPHSIVLSVVCHPNTCFRVQFSTSKMVQWDDCQSNI